MRRLLSWFLVWCLIWGPVHQALALTLDEERKLGEKSFHEVMRQLPQVKDPECLEYLRHLGKLLADKRKDSPFPFKFYMADMPEFNAFALPGGWIFVFRGMITQMETEGELVGVMAHEMSHVYFRHIAQRFQKSTPVNIATIAGMLAGILLGTMAGAPQVGQALTMGSLAGGMQAQLAFSREDEKQADFGAFKLLEEICYPPQEMAETFMRLWREQRYTAATPPTYLLTHPTSPERMENIENLLRRNPVHCPTYDNHRFLKIRTRLMALYDPEQSAQTSLWRAHSENPKDPVPVYGLALLEMRRNQYERALKYLDQLPAPWQADLSVQRARGLSQLRLGNYSQARTTFNRVITRQPQDQEALTGLASCYLRDGDAAQAERVLRKVVKDHPDDDQAQYDLGVALGRLGRTGEASLHLGLAFKERGNLTSARFHLTRATTELAGQPALLEQAQKALDSLNKEKKKAPPKPPDQDQFQGFSPLSQGHSQSQGQDLGNGFSFSVHRGPRLP